MKSLLLELGIHGTKLHKISEQVLRRLVFLCMSGLRGAYL